MKVLSLLVFILSFNTFADVRFEGLAADKIANEKLRNLVTMWEGDFDIDDAGAYGFQVFEMNSPDSWEKTVRNIFYITNYCHDKKETKEINSLKDIFPVTNRSVYERFFQKRPYV